MHRLERPFAAMFGVLLLTIGCDSGSTKATASTRLVVVTSEPTAGSVSAAPPSIVRVSFDRALSSALVAPTWLRVRVDAVQIAGIVSVDAGDARVLTFTPNAMLPAGSTVQVEVAAEVTAADGTTLDLPTNWSFAIAASSETELLLSAPTRLPAINGAFIGRLLSPIRTAPTTLAMAHLLGASGATEFMVFWDESNRTWSGSVPGVPTPVGGGSSMTKDGVGGVLFQNGLGQVALHESSMASTLTYVAPAGVLLHMADGVTTSWSRTAVANTNAASFSWQPVSRSWTPTLATVSFPASNEEFVGVVPAAADLVWHFAWQGAATAPRQLVATVRDRSGAPFAWAGLGTFASGSTAVVDRAEDGHAIVAVLEPTPSGVALHASIAPPGQGFGTLIPALQWNGPASDLVARIAAGGHAILGVRQTPSGAFAGAEGSVVSPWSPVPATTTTSSVQQLDLAIGADGSVLLVSATADDCLVRARRAGKPWSDFRSLRAQGMVATDADVRIATAAPGAPRSFMIAWARNDAAAIDGCSVTLY